MGIPRTRGWLYSPWQPLGISSAITPLSSRVVREKADTITVRRRSSMTAIVVPQTRVSAPHAMLERSSICCSVMSMSPVDVSHLLWASSGIYVIRCLKATWIGYFSMSQCATGLASGLRRVDLILDGGSESIFTEITVYNFISLP